MTRPEPAGVGTGPDTALQTAIDICRGGSWYYPTGGYALIEFGFLADVIAAAIREAVTASRRQAKEEDAKMLDERARILAVVGDSTARTETRIRHFRQCAEAIRKTIDA